MLNRSEQIEGACVVNVKPKNGVFRRIIEEFVQFIFIAIYLWAMFGILALHEAILAKEHGLDYHFYGFAIINSLVLGKVVLVADGLHFANWYKNGRVVYAIVCKAVAFAALLIVFDVAEELIVGLVTGKALAASLPSIGGGDLRGVVFVWVILAVALLPFFAFREVDAALGGHKLRSMILARRAEIVPILSEQIRGGRLEGNLR